MGGPLVDRLLDLACVLGATPGDVLVSRVRGDREALAALAAEVIGDDVPLQRDSSVRDVYSSSFADRLLSRAGARRSQHFQLRETTLLGAPVLQLAAYPTPPVAFGTRLWCDPAIVWLFVPEGAAGEAAIALLARLQPLWERLRAHHGQPMDREEPEELVRLYPLPQERSPALTVEEQAELRASVERLTQQLPLLGLVEGDRQPKDAVDDVLLARNTVHRHLERLSGVLDHSHGSADTKLSTLRASALEIVPPDDHESLNHLLAPHAHLVSGLKETRRNLTAVAEESSMTASLIASAAVSRLLDRSSANRISATAVATAAFLAAVISAFTGLSSVPSVSGRAISDLVRLAGWVGATGIAVGLLAYGVAIAASRPSNAAPDWMNRHRRPLIAALAAVTFASFACTALTGVAVAAVCGGVALLGLLFVAALTIDY